MNEPLDIWLVKDAEPLPFAEGDERLRMGRLAEELHRRGHRLTWWSSTFKHFQKQHMHRGDTVIERTPNFVFRLVEAGGYTHNLSPSRWRHHQRLAVRFAAQAKALPPPDIMVAALPIPSFAAAAARIGRANNVPMVVDVRDCWPDTFLQKSPRPLRPLAWLGTRPMAGTTRRLLQQASGIVAVSTGYLEWGLALAGRTQRDHDRMIPLGYDRPPRDDCRTPSPAIAELIHGFGDQTVIAFVGSFGMSYDLATVCEAASILHGRGRHDLHFVIAGDGDQMRSLRKLTSGKPFVHLTGWLDSADMHALLSRAQLGLVCCISVKDTMPNKIYQYLAYGLPLASSLEGEAEAFIADLDIGGSYSHGEPAQLADLIESLTGDQSVLSAMSARVAQTFASRFEAAAIYREFADLIEAIALLKRHADV